MAKKLYIGNLPSSATQESLATAFGEVGEVVTTNVIKDRKTGENKGFAFVEMTSDAAAQKAIETLNGSSMDGNDIVVSEAKPERNRAG